ncbi:MAG: tRNA dihydrouridine(20/20a) synthase DusA [Gammaproteobacteria bacterium]|nr:tRNA dihydrouridine(20/20a) synthase DusA [Gammaproteobacteria bacterium]MDJ0891620.1 tRNA dihydrouridine(20/20a) synthase DusA [Gammaproteobacteria bacterium]
MDRRLCIAPMMDCTDRHDRYLLRLISRRVLLYTEMVTTAALQFGDRDKLLTYDATERPLACQLGGNDPAAMAQCARMVEERGFDEVNINVGCPSNRVQSGAFGACLMATPHTVAHCVAAMRDAVTIPVTVKTRIGIDRRDSYEELAAFVARVSAAGCSTFIVHARKAWLKGLSPRANRTVPPLRYDVVYRLKQDFPKLEIILNGGLNTLDQARAQLNHVDGVMIGREAYHNPYLLAPADQLIFGAGGPPPSRSEVLNNYLPYVQRELSHGLPLHRLTRHMLGLFHGVPGAKAWRRHLSEATAHGAGDVDTIRQAAEYIGGI